MGNKNKVKKKNPIELTGDSQLFTCTVHDLTDTCDWLLLFWLMWDPWDWRGIEYPCHPSHPQNMGSCVVLAPSSIHHCRTESQNSLVLEWCWSPDTVHPQTIVIRLDHIGYLHWGLDVNSSVLSQRSEVKRGETCTFCWSVPDTQWFNNASSKACLQRVVVVEPWEE